MTARSHLPSGGRADGNEMKGTKRKVQTHEILHLLPNFREAGLGIQKKNLIKAKE